MSVSAAFQAAVKAALERDTKVTALVGAAIYDGAPARRVFPSIELGVTTFRPLHLSCTTMREERIQVDVWSRKQGRLAPAKMVTDAVYAVLDAGELTIADPYALASSEVVLARVIDDPDGITAHGVILFEAEIETVV